MAEKKLLEKIKSELCGPRGIVMKTFKQDLSYNEEALGQNMRKSLGEAGFPTLRNPSPARGASVWETTEKDAPPRAESPRHVRRRASCPG